MFAHVIRIDIPVYLVNRSTSLTYRNHLLRYLVGNERRFTSCWYLVKYKNRYTYVISDEIRIQRYRLKCYYSMAYNI